MVRNPRSVTTSFDLSLDAPITRRLARAVYGVALAFLGVLGLAVVVYGAMRSLAIGALAVVVAGAGVFLGAALLRLCLGGLVSLSRIEAQTEEIAEQVAGIALNTAPVADPARRAPVEHTGE